ncbi:MAG: hypothetical protein LW860_17665 [Xanthomonadaceae bacterium]|jgi:hypothetical protein|nr:hypothetical protein [Xanthomonadaceae bacterium]
MNDRRPADPPKLNQRRRAVYGALKSLFGERPAVVSGCFRLWEREFANLPHFVVTRFVSRCTETVGMSDAERIALTRRTFELMAKPYESLERYPDDLLAATGEPAPAAPVAAPAPAATAARTPSSFVAAAALPAEAIIAGAVGRSLLSPLRAQARSKPTLLGEIVGDAARHARLPEVLRERITTWCSNGGADDAVLADLDLESLRQWVHVLYLAACDASGPVAADRLLAQSISRAGALPAAVEFPPDQLL